MVNLCDSVRDSHGLVDKVLGSTQDLSVQALHCAQLFRNRQFRLWVVHNCQHLLISTESTN